LKKLVLLLVVVVAFGVYNFLPDKKAADGFTLAGLSVGDSLDQINKTLGSEYVKELRSEPGHFSEAYSVYTYQDGISVLVGEKSQQVLQLSVTSDQYETGLKAKVGNSITAVLELYKEYPVPQSNQGDEPLTGWFKNESGQVIIFDSDAADNSTFSPVKPGAKVEQVILTNWSYLD